MRSHADKSIFLVIVRFAIVLWISNGNVLFHVAAEQFATEYLYDIPWG